MFSHLRCLLNSTYFNLSSTIIGYKYANVSNICLLNYIF